MYDDADLRWIIQDLQKQLDPPVRSRRTEKIDWSSPAARRAKLEIVALRSAYGLTQVAACERWLEYRKKSDPHGDYSRLAWEDAQTLRKAVFDR
jgi:hypothetical protein